MAISTENSVYEEQPPRLPELRDYWLFFVGIPVGLAFLFSLVGIRLTNGMPYLAALGYMLLHMFLAWWSFSVCAFGAKYLCRSWRPPVIALCIMGFVLCLVPAAISFRYLGDLYGAWYPQFAANRVDDPPSLSLIYLWHFMRYSIPVLPIYLAGIYGYRAVMHVDWLGYPRREPDLSAFAGQIVDQPEESSPDAPLAGLLDAVELAPDDVVIAVKAEQHYIQIWSEAGKELLRFRFKDVASRLDECDGDQVHRSWWASYDHVRSVRKAGRSIELVMDNDMVVPVSLANRNTVLKALEGRVNAE